MLCSWPMTTGANAPAFYLPLDDAGAGIVSTTAARSIGGATFTRATVAWTKLSTGLWASVASGSPRSCYIDRTTAATAYGGYFAELVATQLVTPDASIRDMTNGAWTAGATMTVAKTGVGIDGVVNSCSRLTGGAVSATNTIFQTLTAAATSRTYSVWLRRVTGTGTVNITQDGGSSYTDVTSLLTTAHFVQVSLTASQLNAAFGIQVVTSTDEILADFNQFEAGTKATSPMATAGAARNGDLLTFANTNFPLTAGTMYAQVWAHSAPTTTAVIVGCSAGQGTFFNFGASTTVNMFDGTNNLASNAGSSIITGVRGVCASYGAAGQSAMITGAASVATGSFDGTLGTGGVAMGIGAYANALSQFTGTIRGVRIWPQQLSDEQLSSMV